MGKITISNVQNERTEKRNQKVLFDLMISSNARRIKRFEELETLASKVSSKAYQNKVQYLQTEKQLSKELSLTKNSKNWIKLA